MMRHLQVAEAGKRRMLDCNYTAALDRYRTALRMALQQRAPEIFMAHYTDCLLDCLEASGDNGQALEIVQRALDEQETKGESFSEAFRASLMRRQIFLLFTLARFDDGDAALHDAAHLDGPAVAALRAARRRRLNIDAQWIEKLKRQHIRSAVTEDHLRRDDAEQGEQFFLKEYAHG